MKKVLKRLFTNRTILFISPVIINLAFIMRLRWLMGEAFIQLVDSSMFVTKVQAIKEFGELWLFNDLGNRNFVETTNFYSRGLSHFLLTKGFSASDMQMIIYFFTLTLIFYSAWYFINKTVLTINENVSSHFASFLAAMFYSYNIQMALFFGGGLGDSMSIFLICIPIFTYIIVKSLSTGLTTELVLGMALILGLNTNVIPFNLAFFGVLLFSFILTDDSSKIVPNILKLFLTFIFSIFVGAFFIFPILTLYIFPDPYLGFNPLQSYLFSSNGINGLFQLFFNWTVKLVWDGNNVFPTYNIYNNFLGIVSIFLLWIISIWTLVRVTKDKGLKILGKFFKFSLVVVLVSFFFAKGNQMPLGHINMFLYDKIPLLGLFRTPGTKFGTPVIIVLSVLLAYTLTLRKSVLLKILLVIAIFIHVYPFFTGINFVGTSGKSKLIKIPQDYFTVSKLINEDVDNGYVLIYPGSFYDEFDYRNGYIFSGQDVLGKLITKPVVYYENSRMLTKSKKSLEPLLSNLDTANFGEFSIRYVIVRNDIVDVTLQDYNKSFDQNPSVEKVRQLDLVSLYKIKSENYTSLYTFKSKGVDISDLVSGNKNDFNLDQTFVIPSLVVKEGDVEIQLNTGFYNLLFLESNTLGVVKHELGNDFANVWRISPVGDIGKYGYDFEVVYIVQKYYFVAMFVSLIFSLFIVLYLLALHYYRSLLQIFFRDIVFSFIFFPVRLFLFFIPKDKSLLGFGSWMGKNFSDNPYFFIKHLHEKGYKLKLFAISNNTEDILKLRLQGISAYRPYSLRGLWNTMRAGTLFTTHSVREDFNIITISKNQSVVQFWHGTPVKVLENLGFLNKKGNKVLKFIYHIMQKSAMLGIPKDIFIVAENEFSQARFVDFFKVLPDRIKILGYPRNDIFFTLNKFSRGSYEKVFIYLPTYRNKNTELSPLLQNLEELNLILSEKNYLLLIKPHPAIQNKISISDFSNIKTQYEVLKTNDAQIGMAFSDVLITDYSGLLFDYALTCRPFIFFAYDLDDYLKYPGLYINYYSDLPGAFASKRKDMLNLIESFENWSDNDSYKNQLIAFKDRFHLYQDGKSSSRLYKYLIKEKIINET